MSDAIETPQVQLPRLPRLPCLPQHDRSPTRAVELSQLRAQYPWDQEDFAPYPSLAIRGVDGSSLLAIADLFIGVLADLPPREWPGLRFLLGRVLASLYPGAELFDRLPMKLWVTLGMSTREGLLEALDALAPGMLAELVALVRSEAGRPSAAAIVEALAGFVFDLSTEFAAELEVAIGRANAKVALVNGVQGMLQALTQHEGSARGEASLAAFQGFLADTILGADRVMEARDEVLEQGLPPWAAALAALLQAGVRISARARELEPGPVDHGSVSRYMPQLPTPNPREDDWEFGRTAVAGPNPALIEGVHGALPEGFAVTDAKLRAGLRALGLADDTSVERAIAQRRLFLTDYALLEGIVCRSGPDRDVMGQARVKVQGQRYLPAPYGLFYRSDRGLAPVAIQLGRDPREHEVFTPADTPELWSRVKMIYLCGDHNHQQMVAHIGGCHLLTLGVVMAIARQLHPSHPLAALFWRHTRWALFTGLFGRQLLLREGGFIESAYSGQLDAGSIEISRRYYRQFDFDELVFPRELARRRVADAEALPDYPFRDDGLALWEALRTFVGSYLRVYYREPADLAADRELQGWLGELRSPQGAHVPGFPAQVETVEALAEVVTAMIFRLSCFHSAVNYAQYPLYGHPDRAPASLMADPRKVRSLGEADFRPGPEPALTQIAMTWASAEQRDTVLTDYDLDWFTDARVWPAVVALRVELARIEGLIDARNARTGYAYDYLRPSKVAVSTNI